MPFNLVLSCDMPGITVPFLRHLLTFREEAEVVVPVDEKGNLEPLCAVYQQSTLPRMEQEVTSGSFALRVFIGQLQVKYVEVNSSVPGFHPQLLANVNTPEDMQKFHLANDNKK